MQDELQLEQGQIPAPGYYWVSIDGAAPRPAVLSRHKYDESYPDDDGHVLEMLPCARWALSRLLRHSTVRYWPITPPEV